MEIYYIQLELYSFRCRSLDGEASLVVGVVRPVQDHCTVVAVSVRTIHRGKVAREDRHGRHDNAGRVRVGR